MLHSNSTHCRSVQATSNSVQIEIDASSTCSKQILWIGKTMKNHTNLRPDCIVLSGTDTVLKSRFLRWHSWHRASLTVVHAFLKSYSHSFRSNAINVYSVIVWERLHLHTETDGTCCIRLWHHLAAKKCSGDLPLILLLFLLLFRWFSMYPRRRHAVPHP